MVATEVISKEDLKEATQLILNSPKEGDSEIWRMLYKGIVFSADNIFGWKTEAKASEKNIELWLT